MVPAGLVRRRLDVKVGAEVIRVFDGARMVAEHARGRSYRPNPQFITQCGPLIVEKIVDHAFQTTYFPAGFTELCQLNCLLGDLTVTQANLPPEMKGAGLASGLGSSRCRSWVARGGACVLPDGGPACNTWVQIHGC